MTSSARTAVDDQRSGSARVAAAQDAATVAATLAAAFFDDPVLSWIYSDPGRRDQILAHWFDVVVRTYLRHGGVYVDGDRAGAVWVPAGTDDDGDLEAALAALSGEYDDTLAGVFEVMGEHHPHERHHYLFLVGTRPEWQGRGIGSALLRPMLERCDRDRTPAYLEATSEVNLRLYLRHGFEVTGRLDLPGGPTMWPMWREPRGEIPSPPPIW